jgi:hypothetical protein
MREIPARHASRGNNSPEVAADLLAIIRGMVDAAGGRSERRAGAFRARAQRAVWGYLLVPAHGLAEPVCMWEFGRRCEQGLNEGAYTNLTKIANYVKFVYLR